MSSNDPSNSAKPPVAASPRRGRASGLLILWLAILALLAFSGWELRGWWRAHMESTATSAAVSDDADASPDVPDVPAAISALRREQHALAQRMSDATASDQVLRDEVLGVGERAALLEQSVTRMSGPRMQGEDALRIDEAELLLTIGQQQLELSSDVGAALHAYALADGALSGSSDPNALNLRQSLAQEIAALRALPPDPRAAIAGRLDAFEASLNAQPLATNTPQGRHSSVFDRVVGSMVEVRHAQAQDLLDPAARDAGLTALRLELTIARIALAQRDASAFHASLTRIDGWLPRLFDATVVAQQRRQLANLEHAPLRFDLPMLGGTLDEIRRLRHAQPDMPAKPAATAQPTPSAERQP
ncbi:MAG: uroporphyrinogen-III C-methyltransferase [Lysobacteraceae bacterium]